MREAKEMDEILKTHHLRSPGVSFDSPAIRTHYGFNHGFKVVRRDFVQPQYRRATVVQLPLDCLVCPFLGATLGVVEETKGNGFAILGGPSILRGNPTTSASSSFGL